MQRAFPDSVEAGNYSTWAECRHRDNGVRCGKRFEKSPRSSTRCLFHWKQEREEKQRARAKGRRLSGRLRGRNVAIEDRDEEAKRRLGYRHPRSFVRLDGSEVLHGNDWEKRKWELWKRCEGQCEQIVERGERCGNPARDPDHIVKRSKYRDDRLSNLHAKCVEHHDLKHPEKQTRFGEKAVAE